MIEHIGVVSEINDSAIFVELTVQSACSSCHAKGLCGVDSKQKIVEVTNTDKSFYKIGETVNVKLRESLGIKAIFLSYILPFLVLVISLITFIQINISEGLSAILALALLSLYYFILYFFKDKIKKEFEFKIEKI